MNVDWEILKRLRANFLSETPAAGGDYWKSEVELQSYDATFAQRIGWKWDAVLDEVAAMGWQPAGKTLLDWGCGTGIAARKFLERWPDTEVWLHDRSKRAMAYAQSKIPGAKIWDGTTAPSTLLLSHVLNETTKVPREAETIFHVEPGTPELSQKVIAIREASALQPIAPCPHSASCKIGGRDWCHHFAQPPREVFTSAAWRKFSNELGIDLRALPVSYVVLSRREFARDDTRVIGRARIYKGYALPLVCRAESVREEKVMERDRRAKVKELAEVPFKASLS